MSAYLSAFKREADTGRSRCYFGPTRFTRKIRTQGSSRWYVWAR